MTWEELGRGRGEPDVGKPFLAGELVDVVLSRASGLRLPGMVLGIDRPSGHVNVYLFTSDMPLRLRNGAPVSHLLLPAVFLRRPALECRV